MGDRLTCHTIHACDTRHGQGEYGVRMGQVLSDWEEGRRGRKGPVTKGTQVCG